MMHAQNALQWTAVKFGSHRSAHLTRLENMSVWSEMNTTFSRFSSRIVFREPGRGLLSCRWNRHLTSSSEGREHKSNHCSLLPTAEWGVGRWHRWHNSALGVRHICLHRCGKITELKRVSNPGPPASQLCALPAELPISSIWLLCLILSLITPKLKTHIRKLGLWTNGHGN